MKIFGNLLAENTKPEGLNDSFNEFDGNYYSGDFITESSKNVTVLFSGVFYEPLNEYTIKLSDKNPAKAICKTVLNDDIDDVINANGIFFCIITKGDKKYIIRDRLGIKWPVFYSDNFYCNSLNLIKESKAIQLEIDSDSIAMFFHSGFILAPHTPLKGVKKLGPGQYLSYDSRTKVLSVENTLTYDAFLKNQSNDSATLEEKISEYDKTYKEAIKKRLAGKEKIGLLLSGGYDSGGNLYATRDVYKGKINAYSIGFKNNDWSEVELAKLVADKFDASFTAFELDGSELNDLPKIVEYFEEPFFENGVFLNYKIISSIPADENDIILGGDGNDQLYGTSSREMAIYYLSKKSGARFFQKILQTILSVIPSLNRLNFHNSSCLNVMNPQQFGFTKKEIKKLFKPSINESFNKAAKNRGKSFNSIYKWRNFHIDIIESALQVIIFKASKLTSAVGINASFPFIDKHMYNLIESLPVKYKLKGGVKEAVKGHARSKYLFKEYLADKLPAEITNRKKQGGFTPLELFLEDAEVRSKLYSYIKDIYSEIDIFDSKYINKFIHQTEKKLAVDGGWFWHKQKNQLRLMFMVVFALWWEQFLGNTNFETLDEYCENR